MESKGSSLPSMAAPASPLSMKPLPDAPRKGRPEAGTDPALPVDPAALQDSALQKMAGHHHHHHHERLKDLTSRVLNGDQDKPPKLCPPPDMPVMKGADALPATASLQRKAPLPHAEPVLKGQMNQLAGEAVLSGSDEVKKRRGRALKTKPPAKSPAITTISPPATTTSPPNPRPATSTTSPLPTRTLATISTSPLVTISTSPLVTISTTSPSPSMACSQPPRSLEQEVKDEEEVKVAEEETGDQGVKEMQQQQQEAEAQKGPPSPAVSFSVGDVVWAKASGYPWWPCMVSTDPVPEHHAKPKHRAHGPPVHRYHVQYFGDCPERGHILERSMVLFRGEEQYEELRQTTKQPAFRMVHKRGNASVPRKFRAQWSEGVSQAREALGLPLDQRMDRFSYVYDQDGLHLNPHVTEKLSKPHVALEPGPEGAREQGAASRLVPPPGPAALHAAAAAATGKKKKEEAVVKKKPARGRAPVAAALSSPKPARRGPARPTENPPRTQTQESTPAVGSEKQGEFGETPLKRRKSDQSNVTKSPSATSSKPEALKKTSKKPPAHTSLSAKRKTPVKSPPTERTEQQKDRRPKNNRNPARQTDRLKVARTEVPPQKKRNTTGEDAPSAKKKRKGSVSGPAGEQLPQRQPRGKRKMDVDHQAAPCKAKKRRTSPCPESEGSGSEEHPDSPSDGLDDPKKTERLTGARKDVCQVCEQPGEQLHACAGQCSGMFHLSCLGLAVKPEDKLLCQECATGVHPCFTCKRAEGAAELLRCYVPHCGKFYHQACARLSPLSVFDQRGLRCPLHTCLSCHLGCRSNGKATKGKMMRCLRCPVAYHVGEQCVSAGSQVVTSTALVCTSHFNAKKGYSHHSHVNVSWCFVCSKGGQLLCCEACPAAFHPDCLNISMPEGSWFCNDCRAGKKPKYQDVIWVKLGTYRWWPAEIRHPRTVPTNIQNLRHQIGEFPVFFFGSKDFFWTHQGRVFPYMEGDRGSRPQKTNIGKVFKNALLEADARFKETKLKREAKEAQENNRKPPPYKFIKVNKPCGKVQVSTADVSEIPKCNCKPSDERPCGFESECLNRMLLYECHPQVCPSGARCCNQDFTKRLYPDTKIIKTAGKGWGLVCLRDIKKGEFVNEYIGELIDEEECRARIRYAQENNISHFYMLTIDKDRIIDAGPKGNYSRFMNHSCQPNCETQKWTVNGDTRVGLFAVCHIPAGTELTFNYNLDCLGNEKTVCRCGAPNCSGFLGDRPKTSSAAPSELRAKRTKRRKRRSEGKRSEDECFRCGDGGQLVLCGKKSCTKAYHLACLGLAKRPFGRWDCPWHHCDVCGKTSEAFCQLCPNSFCSSHQEGALQDHPSSSQLCCLEHEHPDPPPD